VFALTKSKIESFLPLFFSKKRAGHGAAPHKGSKRGDPKGHPVKKISDVEFGVKGIYVGALLINVGAVDLYIGVSGVSGCGVEREYLKADVLVVGEIHTRECNSDKGVAPSDVCEGIGAFHVADVSFGIDQLKAEVVVQTVVFIIVAGV
jgi:hypothetical protein